MKTVGILYLCTGRYRAFWPGFYRSFAQNFLPGYEKQWFVFTDAPKLEYENEPGVHRIFQQAYLWPYSTMKRFSIFLSARAALEPLDYLFFFNANLVCLEPITGAEFLPRPERGEQLLMVQQPGFWNKKPPFYSYDRNPACTAYIPYNCGKDYVSGGLNGGTSAAFLALCTECERRTELDIARGVTPVWHDESQLNRYMAERSDYRLLTPAYWYPEGWSMPFPQKIRVLDKNKWFDLTAVKGGRAKTGPFKRKWNAFCQNYLPYVFCARDALLRKTVSAAPPEKRSD